MQAEDEPLVLVVFVCLYVCLFVCSFVCFVIAAASQTNIHK